MKADQEKIGTVPFLEEVDAKVEQYFALATEDDFALVEKMKKPTFFAPSAVITPVVASIILKQNRHNRRVSQAQVNTLSGILMRAEWKKTHQGLAFYDDGDLMDAQHRLIACLLTGVALDPIMVSGGYAKTDNDAIDAGVKRTAADAASLAGVKEANIKCAIINDWQHYKQVAEFGFKVTLTNHQVKVLAVEYDKELDAALKAADSVLKQCGIAVMNRREIAGRYFEMTLNGWSPTFAVTILTLVNQGTADYEGAPTVALSEAYAKDRDEKSKYKLTAFERQAMWHKVANLYAQKASVARNAIAWKSGTQLPQMAPAHPVAQAA